MQTALNFWIVLFIAAAAQGLFLSVILFTKSSSKSTKRPYLLAALMLSFTVTIGYYITFWMGFNKQLPSFLGLILQFTFLFGPLLYLFLSQLIYGRCYITAWFHFLPFILVCCFILVAPQWLASFRYRYLLPVLQCLHLVVYALINLMLTRDSTHRPAKKVAISFAGYCLCFLVYHLLVWTQLLRIEYDYIVSLAMTVFIYFVGYQGFKDIYFTEKFEPEEKYQKSALTDNALTHIISKLEHLMINEKLYLNGDLKLLDVAEQLNVTTHSLSQAINAVKQKKFNDYLNELRIKEAMQLMQQKEYQSFKLLAIAMHAGFNNKTSFLNAFKKHTGQSPSGYRKTL